MQAPQYKDIQGHFSLLQRFGQGSYGEVFKAEHNKTGRTVAIKKVFKGAQNLVKHMPEIRAMKACVSPYIVAYYGCEWLREDLLIAMELCEFGSLSDVMKIRQRAFNESQVAYIMRRTLRALDYLASNNKVHRDIKPANIMLCGNGKIKLGDLGITKDLKPDGTLRDRIGSVLYLAPEIARDQPYNAKVDIWSLGITAVELLLGKAPRSSERTKEILKLLVTEPQGPSVQLPHASPELLNFLHRVLQVDPSKRPSAAELLSDPFIVKATSASFQPVLAEMSAIVSLSGGFQSALARASNGRIDPATYSNDMSLSSTTGDELDAADMDSMAYSPNGGQAAIVSVSSSCSPFMACQPFMVESEEEINALISRPIVDSPVWIRPTEFINKVGFALDGKAEASAH